MAHPMQTAENTVALDEILDVEQLHESLTAVSSDLSEGLALLRQTYLEDAEDLVARLEGAIATLDFDQIRFAAHTLKSSSALMGAKQLAQLCSQIESQARQNNPDGLAVLVDQARFAQRQITRLLLTYDPNQMP